MNDVEPKQTGKLERMIGVDELWSMFVRMKGQLAPSTLLNYQQYGRKFCGYMRDKEFSQRSMLGWMQHVQESGICGAKINHLNNNVRGFLRWMQAFGYLHIPLHECIKTVNAGPPKESVTFTHEEYEQIKAYATGRAWCQAHLWLCVLAYHTGMSMVDCCHLRWCNVHLDDNGPSYIAIHRIKTVRLGDKAKCLIPIIPGSDLHKWLIHLKDNVVRYVRHDGIDDFVHPDAPGLYACTFSRLGQDLKNLFLRAGIPKGKTFKHFRNSFCSNLVNSGAQIALVCSMTGHNNVKTLLRYLKPDTRALQDALSNAMNMVIAQSGASGGNDGLTIIDDES